jgi:hypothetical protein
MHLDLSDTETAAIILLLKHAIADDAAAARVTLIVWCKSCQHRVEPDPAEMAERYGALIGYNVCKFHGARGGRPRGIREYENSRRARIEGRRKWIARMRKLKRSDQIDRFPDGARKAGLPKRSRDRRILAGAASDRAAERQAHEVPSGSGRIGPAE